MSLFTSYTHLTHKPKNTPQGFTIVELLIVIVVIAILAAISVVAYNGIQDRARATAIQSDLSTAAKKIELARIDSTDGLYPTAITSAMDIHVTKSVYNVKKNNFYYCVSVDRTQYAIGVSKYGTQAGYYMVSGQGISESLGEVWNGRTCEKVGKTVGDAWTGYNWNDTTGSGSWNAVLQG